MEFRWKIGDTWYSNQSAKPVASGTSKHQPTTGDHIDEIISEYEQSGGFKSLDGKGKPMDFTTNLGQDDLFYRTLKHANVRPPWLELQHQIRERIEKLIAASKNTDVAQNQVTTEVSSINMLIKTYNATCPVSSLQKPPLNEKQLENQVSQWM